MILKIIVGTIILFLGYGLYQASKIQHIHITKNVHIVANEHLVFDKILYLENFPDWSPFLEEDPAQIVKVTGKDGQVGAQYHWNGNGGKDLGFQEIKEIIPLKYIKMECDIQKPFVAKPTFEYSFRKVKNGVEVTQDFNLHSGFVDSFFMWMFGAKKKMEKTNVRGLELLKNALEKKS